LLAGGVKAGPVALRRGLQGVSRPPSLPRPSPVFTSDSTLSLAGDAAVDAAAVTSRAGQEGFGTAAAGTVKRVSLSQPARRRFMTSPRSCLRVRSTRGSGRSLNEATSAEGAISSPAHPSRTTAQFSDGKRRTPKNGRAKRADPRTCDPRRPCGSETGPAAARCSRARNRAAHDPAGGGGVSAARNRNDLPHVPFGSPAAAQRPLGGPGASAAIASTPWPSRPGSRRGHPHEPYSMDLHGTTCRKMRPPWTASETP
jgi:hypothetical protein